MKKLLVVLMIVVSTVAMAQYTGQAGQKVTISEALELADDTYVNITGKITERVGDDDYMFADSTGTIKVEIDNKIWRNITVAPEETVTIYGEIDKDFSNRKVDVDSITK